MDENFTDIRISHKLRMLVRFAGGKAGVLIWKDKVYGFPEDITESMNADDDAADFLQGFGEVEELAFGNSRLMLANVSPTCDRSTLGFLAGEIEEEIEIASVFDTLFEAGLALSSNLSLNPLLNRIMSLCEEIFDNEVSAVMLLDEEKKELYWEVSRGEGSDLFQRRMTLPLGQGIAGSVAETGESVLVGDVSQDPRWYRSIDDKSGFQTKSMICVPIKFYGKILGVIEIINKREGEFSGRDLKILEILAAQAGAAIENARTYEELQKAYEELKAINLTREKIINHLSHELRTPLAVISGVLSGITKSVQGDGLQGLDKAIKRGQRNLVRLQDMEAKVDDIMNNRPVQDDEKIMTLIEDALKVIEDIREETVEGERRLILDQVTERLKTILPVPETKPEKIPIDYFLEEICEQVSAAMGERELDIVRNWEEGLEVDFSRSVLKKVCTGLLKNAIENTPDGGRIEVRAESVEKGVRIGFNDFGVGITPLNQKMIFAGFFHTQETDAYSSKRPYEFNAGGAGADLLRTKVFSERYGFSLEFKSSRCRFIPQDKDVCPGMISKCPFVPDRTGCLESGKTCFGIIIPCGD